MKQILVASCFTGGKQDKEWCKLQTYFLNKTNSSHKITKLAVLRSDIVNFDLYKQYGYAIAEQPARKHANGTMFLLDYFKNSNFDYLCLLDSDAWPIQSDWIEQCIEWINQPSEYMTERCGVAAVRFENLDTFPHPCVFFVNRSFVSKPKYYFEIKNTRTNLLCNRVVDLFSNLDLSFFYPLLRTNKLNYHPVASAIYHNTFYHHGAGSRKFTLRSLQQDYYVKYQNKFMDTNKLTENLFKNPDEFIAKLIY